MSLVDSLLYLAACARLDEAYAVMQLARHMAAPTTADLIAATRVVKYLQGSINASLQYSALTPELSDLHGYPDASYGRDEYTRSSITGYMIMLAGAAVSWSSKQQSVVVARSATWPTGSLPFQPAQTRL